MPYDIDKANPTDSSKIADFPKNERDSREAVEGSFSVEHDYTVGTGGEVMHKFTRDTDANIAALSNAVDGSVAFSTDSLSGSVSGDKTTTVLYDGAAWIDTDKELLDVDNQWTQGQCGEYVDLVEGASVASDWRIGNFFHLSPVTSFTLENPTLPNHSNDEAQTATYVITQDGTGGRVITFGSMFRGEYGMLPILSTSPDLVDVLYCTLLPGGTHIAVSAMIGLDLT